MMLRTVTILILLICFSLASQAQDRIKKTDGPILEIKVLEVSSDEISYRMYSNQSGPLYRAKLSQLDWLKVNGEPDTTYYNKLKPKAATIVQPKQAEPVQAEVIQTEPKVVVPTKVTVAPIVASTPDKFAVAANASKRKSDSSEAFLNLYDGKLVVLNEDQAPLIKELIIFAGGGKTQAQGNNHPFGNFNTGGDPNFFNDGGSLHAGLGGYFDVGVIARFSRHWGVSLTLNIATNNVNDQNILGSRLNSPDKMPRDVNVKLMNNEVVGVTYSHQYNNQFITGGPVYFINLTRKTDLMLHGGIGIGGGIVPDFAITYKGEITNPPVGPGTKYVEIYQANYPSGNIFNGFAYCLNAKVKTYLGNQLYLIGKIGYDGQIVNINYIRRDNSTSSNSNTINSIHNFNNLVFGAALGYGF